MERLHAGLSGYSYKPWQGEGRFYPPELRSADFLRYYAERYDSVEMDGTWYRMPSETQVAAWRDGSPDSFCFCFKAHRRITHLSRLKPETLEPLRFMLERLYPLAVAGKLGPLQVQLPPNMRADVPRLEAFLRGAPRTFADIRPELDKRPIRYAFEFRHDSWNSTECEETLRAFGAAWVAAETDDTPPQRRDTADFCYARLRRSEYDSERLAEWAQYFDGLLSAGKPVFVYCKHEDEGSPWIWADELLRLSAH